MKGRKSRSRSAARGRSQTKRPKKSASRSPGRGRGRGASKAKGSAAGGAKSRSRSPGRGRGRGSPGPKAGAVLTAAKAVTAHTKAVQAMAAGKKPSSSPPKGAANWGRIDLGEDERWVDLKTYPSLSKRLDIPLGTYLEWPFTDVDGEARGKVLCRTKRVLDQGQHGTIVRVCLTAAEDPSVATELNRLIGTGITNDKACLHLCGTKGCQYQSKEVPLMHVTRVRGRKLKELGPEDAWVPDGKVTGEVLPFEAAAVDLDADHDATADAFARYGAALTGDKGPEGPQPGAASKAKGAPASLVPRDGAGGRSPSDGRHRSGRSPTPLADEPRVDDVRLIDGRQYMRFTKDREWRIRDVPRDLRDRLGGETEVARLSNSELKDLLEQRRSGLAAGEGELPPAIPPLGPPPKRIEPKSPDDVVLQRAMREKGKALKEKRERKDKKKKKKRKKRRSSRHRRRRRSSSYSGSGSSSSGSDSDSVFRDAPALRDQNEIRRIARERPGALLQSGVAEMTRFLVARGGALEHYTKHTTAEGVLRPIVTAYLLTVFMMGPEGSGVPVRAQREMRTISEALDLIIRGLPTQAADYLVQRFKALEVATRDKNWKVAERLELIPESMTGAATVGEQEAARREATRHLKLAKHLAADKDRK